MPGLWDEVRNDFPAVSRQVYLNTAAAGPTPIPVREAVTAFHRDLEEGGDLHWDEWMNRRERVREALARFVGAQPEEVAFVANTSAGINLIADQLAEDGGGVLANELEFPTVTLPFIHRGVPVHFVPAVEGVVRLESFAVASAPRAATIAVSHVQFANGCRQDLHALGALKGARRLVVCASQGAGAFPIDVRASRIDALACAGHKWLCAGYGAGFVYLSRELLQARPPHAMGWLSVEQPYAFDNRRYRLLSGAARMELGCPAFGPIFALGAAIMYLDALGIAAIAERVLALNLYLTCLLERSGFEVLSPGGEHRSGQTLCALHEPERAASFLAERGVFVTPKPHGVRISTHFFNNEADIDDCLQALVAYRSSR